MQFLSSLVCKYEIENLSKDKGEVFSINLKLIFSNYNKLTN